MDSQKRQLIERINELEKRVRMLSAVLEAGGALLLAQCLRHEELSFLFAQVKGLKEDLSTLKGTISDPEFWIDEAESDESYNPDIEDNIEPDTEGYEDLDDSMEMDESQIHSFVEEEDTQYTHYDEYDESDDEPSPYDEENFLEFEDEDYDIDVDIDIDEYQDLDYDDF